MHQEVLQIFMVEVVAVDELGYKSVLSLKVEVLPVNEPPGLANNTIALSEDSYWEDAHRFLILKIQVLYSILL